MTAHDLITVGRVNMDFYVQNVGAPFEEATGLDVMVGGSPTNIAIGTARLGLRSVAFTAVGEDQVGDFIIHNLEREGVSTAWVSRKPGKLSSLALLGVQPPDHFPLMFYRDDPPQCAWVSHEEAEALPWSECRAVQHSGNALSRGTCADAATRAAELGREHGLASFLDLDLRPVEWAAPGDYGRAMRAVVPWCDVVIGTEEEFAAALDGDDPAGLIGSGPTAVVLKRGPGGVTVFLEDGRHDVAGFPVEVVNTVGAGDAFASGLIARRLRGDDWDAAARFANACGAIEVTRHGCSSAFPTEEEVREFAAAHGGL